MTMGREGCGWVEAGKGREMGTSVIVSTIKNKKVNHSYNFQNKNSLWCLQGNGPAKNWPPQTDLGAHSSVPSPALAPGQGEYLASFSSLSYKRINPEMARMGAGSP